MRLTIVAIGKLRDPWVLAGCAEYEKRLRPRLPVEVIEVKDEDHHRRVLKDPERENTAIEGVPRHRTTFYHKATPRIDEDIVL